MLHFTFDFCIKIRVRRIQRTTWEDTATGVRSLQKRFEKSVNLFNFWRIKWRATILPFGCVLLLFFFVFLHAIPLFLLSSLNSLLTLWVSAVLVIPRRFSVARVNGMRWKEYGVHTAQAAAAVGIPIYIGARLAYLTWINNGSINFG